MKRTTITFTESSNAARIQTDSKRVFGKIQKLIESHADAGAKILQAGDDGAPFDIIVPKEWVSIRPKVKRVLSEEQRKAVSERMQKIRSARKN